MTSIDFKNYSGYLFLEIPTSKIFKNFDIANQLDELSIAIVHDANKPEVTTWKFNEITNALKAVAILQLKQALPFRLVGEDEIVFILQEE